MEAAHLIRESRLHSGLTQLQLARRMGVGQPTVAALERRGANPTARSLERALNACGRTLTATERRLPDVDEDQIRAHLALTPAERLATLNRSHRNLNELLRKARRVAPRA